MRQRMARARAGQGGSVQLPVYGGCVRPDCWPELPLYYGPGVGKLNRLTANASDFEVDASGWVAVAPATLTSDFINPAAHGIGSAALTMGATAPASMHTAGSPVQQTPVTPGSQYTVMASVAGTVDGSAAWLGWTWYDSAGTQLPPGQVGPIVGDAKNLLTLDQASFETST